MESVDKNEIEDPKGSVTSELQTVDFLSHVSPDEMTTTECQTFPDVCSGSPQLRETFLHIRNRLIHLWLENPEILSVGETVIHQCIEAPHNGDVNLINRIHQFLEREGYINLGIFKKRKTESSESENAIIVEEPAKCDSPEEIILNPLVEEELPAENESQIVFEEEIEEDSKLSADSEQEDPEELITGPERASETECRSFPDIPSASPQEKCLNNYLILTQIFKYLPTTSRKKIRLVCKIWNIACNNAIIIKNEVLAIPAPYQSFMSDVFSTLSGSTRKIINLNFVWSDQSLFTDCVSRNFWQKHGLKIRYLVFPYGDSKADDIVQVLKCCLNLEELRIPEMPARAEPNVWAKLSDDHLVFNEMTTLYFRTEMNPERESSTMNEAFSKIFPNVQAVEIKYLENSHREQYMEGSFIDSSRREMLGLMNAVLPLGSKLKSLQLRFDSTTDSEEFWAPVKDVVAVVKHQIKTFEVPLEYFIKRPNTLYISDLRKLENLTSLTLTDDDYNESVYPLKSNILIPVLDNIPELRHIALRIDVFVVTDKYLVLNRIISSKLESLLVSATCCYMNLVTGSTKANRNIFNDTLKSLDIVFEYPDEFTEEMILFLVKNCRDLKAIKSADSCNPREMFKNIFIHHEHLKGLSIHLSEVFWKRIVGCHECRKGREHEPGQSFSFCRFRYLEHLNLCITLRSNEKYSFSGFKLPQLKCLEISFWMDESKYEETEYKKMPSYEYKNLSAFLHAVEEMPRLEYFHLDYWKMVSYSLFLGQCESHKSLKYLCFDGATPKVKSLKFLDHKYAFEVCQSLRFIEYGNKKLFRNIITKEIEELSNDEETRLIELPSFYWPRY